MSADARVQLPSAKQINLMNCMPQTYPIIAIKKETEHVQSFTFDHSFGAKPGQFVMVWLPGVDEVPMSVAFDDGTTTKITFFAVGELTSKLASSTVGSLIGLRGPFGTHYEWEKKQHLILVAGGYGAAPMYFAAKRAVEDGCTIDFVVGARSEAHLLYLEEIEGLKNTTLHIATDDGSRGYKGYNTEVLEKLLGVMVSSSNHDTGSATLRRAQGDTSVFACGPELMMKRISDICAERNVDCAMSLERYMKCGYGICGNCCMDPPGIRIRIDGPVVKNDIVQKLTEFGKYHRDDLGKKHYF